SPDAYYLLTPQLRCSTLGYWSRRQWIFELMTVSLDNSKAVYQGIKAAGIRFLTALPETWLVYLLQMADEDPDMCLIEVAKEEEAIGIAVGSYFAGQPNILLMQNH